MVLIGYSWVEMHANCFGIHEHAHASTIKSEYYVAFMNLEVFSGNLLTDLLTFHE